MIPAPKPIFYKATSFKEERYTAKNIATAGLETVMIEAGINKLFLVYLLE